MGAERAGRLLVLAAVLGTAAVLVARPGVRVDVGWIVPSFAQATPAVGEVPASPAETIPHPTGATDVVLRVEVVGGLLPPAELVRELPWFSLYGDGLVIFIGPLRAIDPPPALPNLRRLRLSEAGIQAVLAAAREAGMIGEDRSFGNQAVTDVGYTVFSVAAGDRVTTTSVWALGFEPEPEMPGDERVRYVAASDFAARLRDLSAWLPADAILEAESAFPVARLQVVSQPTPDAPADLAVVPWPLDPPLASFGEPFAGVPSPFESMFEFRDARCGVVEGNDAVVLIAALERAGRRARWESEGARYALYPRPLLPDETGCRPRPRPEATPAA